jgi:methionyl aminopeptidase
MVPGARLRDVCVAVEDEIGRLGGAPAFPAQTSVNHVAAHYCPAPDDETRYAQGDLAKLDIGVHVDGWVVDTAITVEIGRPDGRHPLVAAARDALAAAIAVAGPGVPVRTLSAAIAASIRAHGLRPMRNLCGHGVGRYVVHCPPPIPNEPDESLERLRAGSAVAIEPFVTDGPGIVAELGAPQVFRVDPGFHATHPPLEAELAVVRALRGLPFARRQLLPSGPERIEATLEWLQAQSVLSAYPPLVEVTRRPVAQAEHTIYVGENGVEVLT